MTKLLLTKYQIQTPVPIMDTIEQEPNQVCILSGLATTKTTCIMEYSLSHGQPTRNDL